MRKLLALLLLSGVATPALAVADPGDTTRSHVDREARREARAEARAERSGGNDRSHANSSSGGTPSNDSGGPPPQPVVHVESSGNHQNTDAHVRSGDGVRRMHQNGGEQPAIQPTGHDTGGAPDTVRNWRSEERHSRGPKIVVPNQTSTETAPTLRRQGRPLPGVFRNRVPVVSNVPHEGTQPPLRVDNRSRDRNHNWNTSWRSNHRYDWQNWRRHHRSHFHLSLYYDPFGWSYQPYQIGWRLWPNYYSSRYWINDPWEYRLPYAPPGYRWIRYWDDAILVDTFTGEAVDVIHNFFW